ncbi:hypothetical protein PLESTB_000310000 [Pleodorina starrii]|uniref:Uncharacterized protein n=1 Tax=Pleodorina starrii TaxID=330485 RepID=A0A9W6EZ12_9CHLO|nr:hypothetical protein PLESTB_000310000 [Pleodorina starrii]GLC76241.1 hypothetical protein PLESTF_001754500 [Pleodorina starrii]
MASARVRQAFRDDESDEEAPRQTASHRSSRPRLDSSGDDDSVSRPAASQQRRPATTAGGRVKHTGQPRLDETGDLRPTTPPAGPASRSRQADWASAVLQMLQNGALVAGQPIPGPDALQRHGSGSISSKASRRPASAAPASSHRRASNTNMGAGSVAPTKIAAARTLDNSSSEDDETASAGMASASLQMASSAGMSELKPQGPPAAEPRGARSSRHTTTSVAGPISAADANKVPSGRLASSTGRVSTGGASSSGGFAAAAAAAFEGLQVAAQSAAHRQQQRTSRTHRISGNDSVASELSHPESLASSRQTLGSSKLSATVQRVVARQRLLDSSSGEEEGDTGQRGSQPDSDVGQAARLLARFKSLSSSASASGSAPAGAPPSPGGVHSSGRKSPTAAVAMIPASKGKGSAAQGARPPSAVGSARARPQPTEAAAGEAAAFTFNWAQSSVASDGISPRMRQAAAAAVAEVSAAAASSLRPLPLTTIVPARLTSPARPQTAPQPPPREPHRTGSMASAEEAGGFAAAGGTAAARKAVAASQPAHVCSSHRIATWLEQQPSLSSVGIADDIVSEYATTVTGTEIDLDHGPIAVHKAPGRAAATAMESIMSGDVEASAASAPADAPKAMLPRSRAVRLSISSDDDGDGARDLGRKAAVGGPAASATERRESSKEALVSAGSAVNNGASRPSAGAAKGAQAAPEPAAAGATTAARRLEFAGPTAVQAAASRLAKDLTSNFSSPSFCASEEQSPNASASPPSETAIVIADKAPTPRAAPTAAAVTAKEKQRLATSSGASPHRRQREAEQQLAESSSPESGVRIASGGGQRTKAAQLMAGGRLTPNELRVMLSVLSRPAWGSGAGATMHAVASALSPQPSHSGDSVQSFSYSEMLQVMRAMSSSGDGGGSPSSGSAKGVSTRDEGRSGRAHKSSRKESAPAAVTTSKQQQLLHNSRQPQSARELPTAHTSMEAKGSHSARSFDASSGSLLGEHPMAAPLERDWSASASTVSGRGGRREELQHQQDFVDMVRLWNLLTGRQVSPEALEMLGLHLDCDGTATPRSSRGGPGSVLSAGGGSSVGPPSAAVLAASAAAMATSAVMAAAGGRHPFSEANVAAATAAGQFSQEQHQRHGSPAAAAGKTRPPPSTTSQSPGEKPMRAHSPLKPKQAQEHEGAADPASVQSDLVRLIGLLNAAGQADLVPPEASEATKGDLGRLVQLLRAGMEAQAQDGGSPSRRRAAPAGAAAAGVATALPSPKQPARPVPGHAAVPVPAPARPPVAGGAAAECSYARPSSSRRSSADTVETGQALGRLYQSLRNLRVRDEGDQTEGGELRPITETISGCAQTDAADLQASAARATGENDVVGVAHGASPRDATIGVMAAADGPSQGQSSAPGGAQASLPPTVLSGLVAKDIRVTRALKLPNGQLVELDSVLALAADETPQGDAVNGGTGQWLQDLRALNTASTTPAWSTSPSTTDGGVQTDLTAHDVATVLLPAPQQQPLQQQQQPGARRHLSEGTILSDASPSLVADSADGMGTSVTVAPAIAPGGFGTAAASSAPVHAPKGRLTMENAAAAFPLRNLPIASEGGIMDAPNQEAVTAGRLGSAGGMLAYLEAADPTTATALLELVQALQLMTLHQRRRRWISDGSSTSSGAYLVDPLGPDSLGGSSAGATTLRYSFGTSIGPSVSQAGQASLLDMPDAAMAVAGAPAVTPAVKAATTGGVGGGAAAPAAGGAQHPKRQTHNAGLPPRPVPANEDPTARHLRRALRAVSGGGTVRVVAPTRAREAIRGHMPTGADVGSGANGVRAVSSDAVTEAAKVHIARALELLSQPQVSDADAPTAATTAAARAAAADAELRAQEELVAALLALLAPDSAALPGADPEDINCAACEHAAAAPSAAIASQDQVQQEAAAAVTPGMQAEPLAEPHRTAAVSAPAPQLQPAAAAQSPPPASVAAAATPPSATELSPSRPRQLDAIVKTASPLHARIQEVLQQAERASAGISSLQVGLSPTAPAAAEVLDGVPFEQAVGFIMDGLRDFDGGPSQLARHLHLMYNPSSGGIFYPTALESPASRRQTMVALGAAAVLTATTGSDVSGDGAAAASEVVSDEQQPLTDAERERVKALVSEAVAAADALARVVQREEEWTAERLGLPAEEEVDCRQDAQLIVAPASGALAGASTNSSRSSSPARQHSRPMSAGSAGASSKMRFASAGSAASSGASRLLQQPQASPPGSPSVTAAAAAVVSPRRLIAQVADLGADAMASLLPGTDLAAARASVNSAQRSAPVTTAGVPPIIEDGGVMQGHVGTAYTAPVAAPQTFGGAMDLPEDSALGPAVLHSMPYLPYGDLDEQLLPIQPGPAGDPPQARRPPHATAELLPGAQSAEPQKQSLLQSAPTAPLAASRVPTFATPSAPAVRGAPSCPQPSTTGGAISSAVTAAAADPRLASTFGGTTASGPALAVAAASCPAAAHDEDHTGAEQGAETSDDGWESDMEGAARICSPESNPSEVISFAAALLPLARQQPQLADATDGPAPSVAPASPAAPAVLPQPTTRPSQAPGGVVREPSMAAVDPEVPPLTAMDRFLSPRPSYVSPYTSESPRPPAADIRSSSPMATRDAALTSTETISGASLEVQPQQSSAWSSGLNSDAQGGFPSVRLARDAMSGRSTARVIEDEDSVNALPLPGPASHAAAGVGEVRDAQEEEEVRARRALFAAPAREGLEQKPVDGDATAAAVPAAQTEQLLTQAAQLLLQAMQRAAEGQPEQEVAFRVLAPVLQGLAAADQPEQMRSFGSVDVQLSAGERGPSFTFGEVPTQQLQQSQQLPAGDSQHLATAADLESFKDDVMAGVRTALMEIVDMIGSTVMQRAAAPGGQQYPEPTLGAPHAPAGEDGWETGAMTPERSSSPFLGQELGSGQQEIRITRAELEAFMFGKAVLGSTAGDDLLGVRLRELYASQPPKKQDDDEDLAGGYDAASIASNDPRALRDRGSGSLSSAATAAPSGGRPFSAPSTAVSGFGQRRPRHLPDGPEAATPRKLPHSRLGVGADEPEAGSPSTVPRDSPLRQPLADSADFKSLFRRSIEHLRGHLQPAHVDTQRTAAAAGTYASTRPATAPLPRAPRQPAPTEAAAGAAPVPAYAFEATLSPAGVPQQLAAVAAVACPSRGMATVAPRRRSSSSSSDSDVELDAHLSGGLLPEPTAHLARLPDPAAPAVQLSMRPQPHSRSQLQPEYRRNTVESNPEAGAIGDFLAALAEPGIQLVGVLAQPGGSSGGGSSGNRLFPKRSIVIEELADEQQQQQRFERPSCVPGFVTTNSGGRVVMEAEDGDEEELFGRTVPGTARHGVGTAQLSSPRVMSEGSLPSLRLHNPTDDEQQPPAGQPLLPQHPHLYVSQTASTTPVPRAVASQQSGSMSVDDLQPPAGPAASSAPAPVTAPLVPMQYPQTQVNMQTLHGAGSRLKMSSAPGAAVEDRPLYSYGSEGGAAASPPRRRTHSPGPSTRPAALRAEPSAAAAAASVSAAHIGRSMQVVPSPPGTSLDELEGCLRAFRSRIGTDETGDGSVLAPAAVVTAMPPQLPLQHVMRAGEAAAGCDPFRRHVPLDLLAGPLVEPEDVRRDSSLAESVSVNTARRVVAGFNVHTIRASGASALAAAAAVEQAFSPRTERARELAAAAAAVINVARNDASVQQKQGRSSTDDTGSGISGPTDASHGSSSATPTNPLLREHLEHFQALLEKANDLVDRLMLADEDLASEGGAADPSATPSPHNATPTSARRQLNYRSGSVAGTPQRQAAGAQPLNTMAPSTPADINADAGAATPTPASLQPLTSLDPELAALFPATAARLARPHAHVEQSPDAANSLLSSAVTAVPQLAAGADRARSLSSTPANHSPAASVAELRIAAAQLGHDAAPSAAGTPLALVATLLADAHSRMEFRSLDEQRGADRILSAVLDEHFAHVLGTPRGFLTPERGQMVRTAAVTSMAGAEAVTPPPSLPAPPQLAPPQETPQRRVSAAGPANLSGAFSRAFASAAEAAAAADMDGAPEYAAQPSSLPVLGVPHSPQQAGVRHTTPVGPGRSTGGGSIQQQKRQSPSAKMQEEMNSFLAQVMQQRSDILTSALDHVHRAGFPAGSAPPSPPPGVTANTAPSAGARAAPAMAMPREMLAAENAMLPMRHSGVSEAFAMPLPPDAIATTSGGGGAAASAGIDAYLPSSAIPATSGGLPLMPQPLMPYQELDSDSAPTSYNVSVAGSAVHAESSPAWSRGPSPRSTVVLPVDPASHRVSSVAAASTTDSTTARPPTDHASMAATVSAEPTEVRVGRYDLSHLIDDDESTLSGGPSSVYQRGPVAESSGRASTFKTSSTAVGGSHSHVPAGPEALHESALRYNPVYDPLDSSSLGGAPPCAPFGAANHAAAAAAAANEFSGNYSDGGSSFAGGMTTLHHETAYTPLALAASGSSSEGGDGALTTSLHARLRSAGGTSTAVLVPNPTYDDPAELYRHSPAAMVAAGAAAGPAAAPAAPTAASESVSAGNAHGAAGSYPRLQLQFSDASAGGPIPVGATFSASGPNTGAALPLSPVDAMASPAAAGLPAPRGASSAGGAAAAAAAAAAYHARVSAGGPRISSVGVSEVFPATMDLGGNSADLSSLLANSLTESQLNLLSVAPELPNSRPQSWLQHPELSAGCAASYAKAAAVALTSAGGTPADVTMSLDFDEISREAAALADTLSGAVSGGAIDLLKAKGPAEAATAAGTGAAQAAALAAGKDDAQGTVMKDAPRSPSPLTPSHKRHAMGDMVAAAVERFESGAAFAPAEVPATDDPALADCTAAAAPVLKLQRSSSSGIPRGPPSPGAAGDVARLSRNNSLGAPSSDWQSVALSISSGAGLPRQVTGAEAEMGLLGAPQDPSAPPEAATVVTREWVPTTASQEVPEGDLVVEDAANEQRPSEAPLQEQESAGVATPAAKQAARPAGRPGGNSPAGSAASRQSDSPARTARRSCTAGTGILGSGRASNSPGGNSTMASASAAGRQQQARSQVGVGAARQSMTNARPSSPAHTRSTASVTGAGSPASTTRIGGTPAASASSTAAARRATQSPLRTTPVSRTVRASAPGGRMAASNPAAAQQSQAGQAAGGEGKSVRTGRRGGG